MTDTTTGTAVYNLGNVGLLCTIDGLDVLAQGLADEAQIKFTKVEIGDGILTAESEEDYMEQVLNLKAMLNWRLDIPIAEIINQGDGQVLINAIKDNAEVPEGFFAREQAIYAINPATGKEILYSYRNSGDKSSFILKCKVLSCARGGRLIGVVSDDGIIVGAYYQIADGVNQELIQVKGVAYSTDYYRVTLMKALTYDYNLDTVKLYQSTITAGVKTVDKKSHTWKTNESFKGIEANIERKIYLDTSMKNTAALKISGAGMVTADGYFTLKKDFSGSYSYNEGEFPEPSTIPGGGDYDDVEEEITLDDIKKLFDGE